MNRTNLFDLLKANNTIGTDVTRLHKLFTESSFAELNYEYWHKSENYSLKDFIEGKCFFNWKNRHRCLNVDEFLSVIQYKKLLEQALFNDIDAFLTVIETIYNFWYLALDYLYQENNSAYYALSRFCGGPETAEVIKTMMDECLSEFNQKAFYFPDEEKCIVAEDSPQVSAAAEASTPGIALEIVRYHHRQLAGDIAKKKAILKALGDELEGRKKEISSINATLYNNITAALNNLNIRHNNINPNNKSNYHKAVAEMSSEELEKHYDDLYQLILLAILEMDNVKRQHEMKELIQSVTGK